MPFVQLAYIDPVSGTIIVQLIFAGAVGTIAFFRRSLMRILGKLLRGAREGRAKKDSDE